MPRAIWKGSISFGLVTIPVEAHTGVRDHRPRFRLLHARDESPVRYERVCQREGRPVAGKTSSRATKARMKGARPRLKATTEPVRGEVVDLMERLRKSLEGTGKPGVQKRKARRPTRVRRARRAA
jgi:non-homologous end joining protein Ku